VQEFDINSGQMRQSYLYQNAIFPTLPTERTKGIQDNLAFASLTFNPTGTIPASGEPIRLFTATESALMQDLDPPSSEGTKSVSCTI